MAFVPIVGSIAEIIMRGRMTAAGSDVKSLTTTFHYRLSFIGGALTKAALEAAFFAAASPNATLLAAYNTRYVQSENTVRYVDDAQDAVATVLHGASTGAIATDSMPTNATVSLLLRTGKRGKSYRGSKHFPASNEADTTGDVLTGAGLARWQAVQAAVLANLVDANGNIWVPSVLSRQLSTLMTNPTNIVANDVTAVLLNLNVGTMRRRRVATVR